MNKMRRWNVTFSRYDGTQIATIVIDASSYDGMKEIFYEDYNFNLYTFEYATEIVF
jgi:hypothetical protein